MARLLRAETTSFRCRRSTFVRSIADRRSVRMRGKGQASFLDNGERCRLCNSVISVFRRIPRQNSAERSKDDNFFTRRAISLFRFGDTVLFDEQNRRELGEGFIFFFFHQLDGSRLDRRRQKYRMENVNGEDRSSAQPRAIQLNQEYFSGRYCHEEFRFFSRLCTQTQIVRLNVTAEQKNLQMKRILFVPRRDLLEDRSLDSRVYLDR